MVAHLDRQKVDAHRVNLPFEKVYGVIQGGTALLGSGNTVYFVPLG